MKTTLKLFLFTISVGSLSSCSRMLTGTVSCKDIATYTSPYGLLNSIQANVGDVYYINQKDKFVGYIFHEKVDSSDVTIDSEVNSLVIAADIDLSADLDAETPKIKLLSTKIEQQLERNSKLKLIKPSRVRLKNPYKFLNRIESNYATTFSNLNNSDVMFMAVTSVVLADSLALQTQNSDSTSTGIQTLKVDGFTIKLTSNCDALIDVEGNKAGVFFKSVFFTYDPQTKRLAPYTQLFDFKGYHVNTVNQ